MIRKTRVLMVLGLVLLIGGVAVARRPRSFGWTACMPLADAVYSPWMVVLDAPRATGDPTLRRRAVRLVVQNSGIA
ncbi:hypothetical protein FE374_11830 [Georgenia yuyongxinii]|uniref:Uncharacterized protein n=1 Tax=Georgenia yuyongxinii TaxID=2589797 RepID=A0A5B8C3L6_9MICO|nr:hypothetical protein [Georgenia yuyongxinii]QDC25203.1 hypothetical protein FE374_11830 [Georgenia yuyongxinii]